MKKGYLRVSTKKQADKGESIETQEYEQRKAGFKEFYKDKGKSAYVTNEKIDFDLTEKYFIVKYRIDTRPGFKQALFDARDGKLKEFGIYKWDRLARDISMQEDLNRYFTRLGVKIVPVHDTDNPLARQVFGVLNQQESTKKSEQITSNYQFKFEYGLPTTNRRKKGYKWNKVKIGDKYYKSLIPDKKELNLILDIFSEMDYKDVCNKHNINPQTYYNIKKDKFYCGYVEFKGEYRKGIHEPLITEKFWKQFQN